MAESATPMLGSVLPSLLALVAILLLIPGVFWLLKRMQLTGSQGTGALKIVTALGVGPRERIVVINAAGRYLVVGITGQSMTLLTELDHWPQDTGALAPGQTSFANLLARFGQHAPKQD